MDGNVRRGEFTSHVSKGVDYAKKKFCIIFEFIYGWDKTLVVGVSLGENTW